MADKPPIPRPASQIAVNPDSGALTDVYVRLIDAMVKQINASTAEINELKKRVTALGG